MGVKFILTIGMGIKFILTIGMGLNPSQLKILPSNFDKLLHIAFVIMDWVLFVECLHNWNGGKIHPHNWDGFKPIPIDDFAF
jgi:hypothetical protein